MKELDDLAWIAIFFAWSLVAMLVATSASGAPVGMAIGLHCLLWIFLYLGYSCKQRSCFTRWKPKK